MCLVRIWFEKLRCSLHKIRGVGFYVVGGISTPFNDCHPSKVRVDTCKSLFGNILTIGLKTFPKTPDATHTRTRHANTSTSVRARVRAHTHTHTHTRNNKLVF
mmetsp:Transcript_91643/g.133972  ORF Transcript_91643/g.133972 Transcript_91643/m.133972 type:complete len:103 (+) Transcript_91643:231-539(+)